MCYLTLFKVRSCTAGHPVGDGEDTDTHWLHWDMPHEHFCTRQTRLTTACRGSKSRFTHLWNYYTCSYWLKAFPACVWLGKYTTPSNYCCTYLKYVHRHFFKDSHRENCSSASTMHTGWRGLLLSLKQSIALFSCSLSEIQVMTFFGQCI